MDDLDGQTKKTAKKRSIADLAQSVTPELRMAGQLAFSQSIVQMKADFERTKSSPQWRAMEKLEAGLLALHQDPEINVSEPCIDLLVTVLGLLNQAWPHHPIEKILQPLQKHFDGVKSKNALHIRYQKDKKQTDKVIVRECWDDWQKQPDRYSSKAAFARDMRDKFPNLESQPVIERWCRKWERKP